MYKKYGSKEVNVCYFNQSSTFNHPQHLLALLDLVMVVEKE